MKTNLLKWMLGLALVLKMALCAEEGCKLEMLNAERYGSVAPFFADFHINEPLLHCILDQQCAGSVLADHARNPTFALVCNPAGYAFAGGNLTADALQQIAAYLKTLPQAFLACPLDWEHLDYFEKEGFLPGERIQLKWAGDLAQIEDMKSSIPSMYTVGPIDPFNFKKCIWHTFISGFYGGDDNFFLHGKGFCLSLGKKIASESYGIIAQGKAELGVATAEEFRNQNLGTFSTCLMLEYCHKNGLVPYWSCYLENPASLAIALKLGFVEDCRYCFLKRG